MIFASFGNVPKDFSRFARALDTFAGTTEEKVYVQYGYTLFSFQKAIGIQFLTHDELMDYIRKADIVVLQGGWGTISEALFLHKRIVAVSRRPPLEHNHEQTDLVRKLEELGCIIGVYDEKDLPKKIERARSFVFQKLQRGSAKAVIQQKLREWKI